MSCYKDLTSYPQRIARSLKDVYLDAIRSAGFDEVAVIEESAFNGFADSVSSIRVRAIKPL